ncbi:MAG: ATP-grasp domain-containing protein [Patescibacteria group bacterium]
MKNLRVGVLRGGPSGEYTESLGTGSAVLQNLPESSIGIDIFIGRDGVWHVGGIPTKPGNILSRVDVIWNALHGAYGEDGTVQRMLEMFGVPYTGSEPHASFVGMNKSRAKDDLKDAGIRMARHTLFRTGEEAPNAAAHNIFTNSAPPWIIKPIAGGSSIGICVARTFPELISALTTIASGASRNGAYIVEERVRGKEATVGVINGFRGEEIYVLPPVEIRPPEKSQFFDYTAKYSGESEEICPGNFSRKESDALMDVAKRVHKTLGLRHYSRSDFIVSRGRIYFLEVNTLPALTEKSLFPKALDAVGASLAHFIEHVLGQTLTKKVRGSMPT